MFNVFGAFSVSTVLFLSGTMTSAAVPCSSRSELYVQGPQRLFAGAIVDEAAMSRLNLNAARCVSYSYAADSAVMQTFFNTFGGLNGVGPGIVGCVGDGNLPADLASGQAVAPTVSVAGSTRVELLDGDNVGYDATGIGNTTRTSFEVYANRANAATPPSAGGLLTVGADSTKFFPLLELKAAQECEDSFLCNIQGRAAFNVVGSVRLELDATASATPGTISGIDARLEGRILRLLNNDGCPLPSTPSISTGDPLDLWSRVRVVVNGTTVVTRTAGVRITSTAGSLSVEVLSEEDSLFIEDEVNEAPGFYQATFDVVRPPSLTPATVTLPPGGCIVEIFFGFSTRPFDSDIFGDVRAQIDGSCLADLDRDGTVDGTDFVIFVNSFSIGDTAVDGAADVTGGPGACNGDGTIDGDDYIAFLNAFAAGC